MASRHSEVELLQQYWLSRSDRFLQVDDERNPIGPNATALDHSKGGVRTRLRHFLVFFEILVRFTLGIRTVL